MSTEENKKQQFNKLTRDIDWQRASFFKYCLDITESNASDGDEEIVVQKILGGYLVLAMTYYQQFRGDLKKHYEEDNDIQDSEVKLALQDALEKLVDEWHRAYSAISALRSRAANKESKRLLDQMIPFVDVAMNDVSLSRETFPVALQFGQSYSLRYANYIDGFAALSIPLWVLESPWEWTILWHELAGEKVRMLRQETPGYFEVMLGGVLNGFSKKKSASAIKSGWSVDWVKELFEDSFSVLNFPIHFLDVFENLLARFPDGGKDQRHPPRAVRLAVAMCLHFQKKGFLNALDDFQNWGDSQWEKWDELVGEKHPERLKHFDPKMLLNSDVDIQMAWQTARVILEWHTDNVMYENNIGDDLRKIIGGSIIAYSHGENYQKVIDEIRDALTEQRKRGKTGGRAMDIQSGYSTLFDRIRDKKKLLEKLPASVTKAHPQVEKLLTDLGYKELLELSFFDVDFHNLNDIHFRQNSEDFWVDPTTWHNALFDSMGKAKGKFSERDMSKPLKLGFIEIEELDKNNAVVRRWQTAPTNWNEIQKSKV